MIAYLKKLFGKTARPESDEEEIKTEYEVRDLKRGYLLDYDLRSWEVTEVSTYTWDNGVKEYEYTLFDGKETLYLGYAPADNQLSMFWEGGLDAVWPDARKKMRLEAEMSDAEFNFDGNRYYFAGEGVAMIRTSNEKFEMRNWLFESGDQQMLISFNKYEDKTLGVYIGKKIPFVAIGQILPRKV